MPSDPTTTRHALLELYARLGRSSRTTRTGPAPVSIQTLQTATGIPVTRLRALAGTYRREKEPTPLRPEELRAIGEAAEELLGVPWLAISRALVGLDGDDEERQVAAALAKVRSELEG